MDHQEIYGQYVITSHPLNGGPTESGYWLVARNQNVQETPRSLKVVLFIPPAFQKDPRFKESISEKSLACLHGLLDFNLFDVTNEYRARYTLDGPELQLQLDPEVPDFEMSEEQIFQQVLSILHRTLRELPKEYTNKRLDPLGVCVILKIEQNKFQYSARRLADRGWIESHGDLFEGEIHITEKGIEALEQMERSLAKPTWKTTQPPDEVKLHIPEIVQTIKEWVPKQRYRNEETYQAALAEYLVGQGIEAPEQQGASLVDVLAARGIGIEARVNPDRGEYDRLSGQITRHLEGTGIVVVLILRPDRRDLLEEYEARFADDERVIFIAKG
jgi:hypothetical protein